ncbi:MAG TPA: CocE/NonD family hydrolase C-terminal non-catalytic domain-containing protein [Mycobacterium sp.]|nr:CocE/NonD family hydrolase C-terminal non-catalytic domain-containing protein [Mycobacterium sp.]
MRFRIRRGLAAFRAVTSTQAGLGHSRGSTRRDALTCAAGFRPKWRNRVEKLNPGQVVEVEIDLLPIGLVFHPGEQLRQIISAQNLFGSWMPGLREYTPQNSGQHIIHTGGDRASYLQLPLKPA